MRHKVYLSQAIGLVVSLVGIVFGVKYLIPSINKYEDNSVQAILSGVVIALSLTIFFVSIYSLINREQREETNELLEEILMKLEEKSQSDNNDIDVLINNTKE